MDYLISPMPGITVYHDMHKVMWVDVDIIEDTKQPVWAFSDGPPGDRSGSTLFSTFAEGAAAYPGYAFVIR